MADAASDAEPDPALVLALRQLGCADLDELRIGDLTAGDLARRFGTPLFVFDANVLRTRVDAVRTALGPRVELLWSVKANPSLAVTNCLLASGVGAEIASVGELQLALAAGHRAEALRFTGPGKSDGELAAALAAGLGTFHVESLDELRSLERLAAEGGRTAAVAIRVNLPVEMRGSRMRMGGSSSRFGVDVEQVPDVVRTVERSPCLELRGLHVYGGTQCFEAAAFVDQAALLCQHADEWERQLGVRFWEIDVGGGFGIAVFRGDPAFDLAAAGRGLAAVIARYDRPDRRWFVELGRFLAAPAGVYLTRIVRCKKSGDQRHAVLDGGMHHAAAAAGLGTIVRRPPLLVAAERLRDRTRMPITLGGPLCTPADQFADQLALPELATGDLVAVLHAGAYGLTYSPTGFLSHPSPAEVMVDGGAARIVRARGDVADALRGQRP